MKKLSRLQPEIEKSPNNNLKKNCVGSLLFLPVAQSYHPPLHPTRRRKNERRKGGRGRRPRDGEEREKINRTEHGCSVGERERLYTTNYNPAEQLENFSPFFSPPTPQKSQKIFRNGIHLLYLPPQRITQKIDTYPGNMLDRRIHRRRPTRSKRSPPPLPNNRRAAPAPAPAPLVVVVVVDSTQTDGSHRWSRSSPSSSSSFSSRSESTTATTTLQFALFLGGRKWLLAAPRSQISHSKPFHWAKVSVI